MFNYVSLANILVSCCIFGLVSLIITSYKILLGGKPGKWVGWFEQLSYKWTISMSFLKILLVYFCVSYIDHYQQDIIEVSASMCSDKITNQCLKTLGSSLLDSREDDLFVFKITMLMLAFEVINFLTPKIVHLRKQQSKKIKID
mmetsp:Transcript_18741/g.18406  ORF Transcript_18741/g.18406 Transcript_18741/m.18406 type:complete len:144 (+) Transcript_18741:1215-1646(+)